MLGDTENAKNRPAKVPDDCNGYYLLANAIIIRAVLDFKIAYKNALRDPEGTVWMPRAQTIEKFFYSGWFCELTSIDGKSLIKKVKEEVEKEVEREVIKGAGKNKKRNTHQHLPHH